MLDGGHGGPHPALEVRRRFFMGKDIPVVVLMVTLQVIAGAAT